MNFFVPVQKDIFLGETLKILQAHNLDGFHGNEPIKIYIFQVYELHKRFQFKRGLFWTCMPWCTIHQHVHTSVTVINEFSMCTYTCQNLNAPHVRPGTFSIMYCIKQKVCDIVMVCTCVVYIKHLSPVLVPSCALHSKLVVNV